MCKSDGPFVSRQHGLTALIAASANWHVEVVQTLRFAGGKMEAADKVGCRGACHTLELRAVIYVSQT